MDSEAEIFCNEDDIVNYVVLNDAKIQSLQKNEIERVSTVLFVTEVEARILLLHYHWNVSKIYNDWLFDEQRVRRIVGIFDHRARVDKELECGICFDSYPGNEISTLSCAHRFCNTCWTSYIKNSIKCDGIGCLLLKCPLYKCSAVVGHDMVDRFITMEDKSNYSSFFIRSYVESKKNMMWCPAPRCDHAIEFAMPRTVSKTGVSCYDVTCLCLCKFCWNCRQEAHSPVDCDTACEWLLENREESGNRCWILANTKPCPKCKVPIEKNGGCMRMRCVACGYHFFWDSPCSYHGGRCNQHYDVFGNSQRRTNQPMRAWSHYYEGWIRHESLNNLAMMEVKKLDLVLLKENTESAKIFVREAWLQVIEWRRFLKWTYVYGYYMMSEHEHAKQQWFEYFQGVAGSCLEKLRQCLEKELELYLKVDDDRSQAFSKFKTKIIRLTKVTKVYFQKLVKAMENGFADFIC